jgi:hypothetical protein
VVFGSRCWLLAGRSAQLSSGVIERAVMEKIRSDSDKQFIKPRAAATMAKVALNLYTFHGQISFLLHFKLM